MQLATRSGRGATRARSLARSRNTLGYMRQLPRWWSTRDKRAMAITGLALLLAWVLVAIPVGLVVFTHSSKSTEVASHEAVVSPTFDGYATLDLGPYLPNLRYPTGERLGVDVKLGKTDLPSYEALIQRYAVIGSRPEGEIAKLRQAVTDMAKDSAASGALIGLAGPALWIMLGRRRRRELLGHVTVRRATYAALAGAVAVAAVLQPWTRRDATFEQEVAWRPITEELPDVPIPAPAQPLEVETGLMTSGTKRLAESAFDTYDRSVRFYSDAVQTIAGLEGQLRRPEDGERVAILVSDRHDNIGMDKVARAIADQAGATMLLDAGDDTSTGAAWEAFSLDSLHQAFADFDHRYFVAGNHDNGPFVTKYLSDHGFTPLNGEPVGGPDGIRLLGVHDPRSSGLGTWRDETGLSFAEQADRLADLACALDERDERVSTLLVHDANSGRAALQRGCVDLVLGGHVHAQLGPTAVTGDNGRTGYTYTTGTTGGAAYALAIGSKLRRDAMVTLVTYRDGRPVGIQPVTVRTVGDLRIGNYIELELDPSALETRSGPSGEESP